VRFSPKACWTSGIHLEELRRELAEAREQQAATAEILAIAAPKISPEPDATSAKPSRDL